MNSSTACGGEAINLNVQQPFTESNIQRGFEVQHLRRFFKWGKHIYLQMPVNHFHPFDYIRYSQNVSSLMLTEVDLLFTRTWEIISVLFFSLLYQIILKWHSTFSCLILSKFSYALIYFSKIISIIIVWGFVVGSFFAFIKPVLMYSFTSEPCKVNYYTN